MVEIKHDPFPSNQKVFIIDADQAELTTIHDNLIPELQKITNYDELSIALSSRLKEKGDFATLIISSALPPQIEDKFGDVVTALNTLNDSKDFEEFRNSVIIIRIGKKRDEDNALKNTLASYHNVSDFINDINHLSSMGITQELDLDEDSKRLINNLQANIERLKSNNEQKDEEIKKHKKKLNSLEEELSTIITKSEIAEQKMEKARALQKEAEKQKADSQNKIKALTLQTEKDAQSKHDLEVQIADLETQITAKNELISKGNSDINSYVQKVNDLQDRNKTLEQEIEDLTEQQSEIQQIAKLRKNNKVLQDEVTRLKDEMSKLKSDVIVEKAQKDEVQKRLERFRNGQDDLITTGYSKHLPVIELKQTNVIYFKILKEPNYFWYSLEYLFKNLLVGNLNSDFSSQLVILRQNNGGKLDDKLFPDVPIIDDLGKLIEPNNISRLLATPKMSGHTDVFENNNDLLIMLDYINNEDIYVETKGNMEQLVVTHSYEEFKRSNLGGKPIVIDKNHSLFDLSYLKTFDELTNQNRINEMINRLDPFLGLPTISEIMRTYLKG